LLLKFKAQFEIFIKLKKENLKSDIKLLSGWGRTNAEECNLVNPDNINQIKNLILEARKRSLIPRGLGRCYGDAAQIKGETVIEIPNFNKISINNKDDYIEAEGGASLDSILKFIIPKGYFLPVSPGTRYVTVGGAIAADVHGKNHHVDGSFGNHIRNLTILDGNAEIHKLFPESNFQNNENDFFWATVGGMGLTGLILKAEFDLLRINTSFIKVDTSRFKNIETLMENMIDCDTKYRYSVAWIDSLDNDFRGVLTCGNHAELNDLPEKKLLNPLHYDPKAIASAPIFLPKGILNKFTVKIFNEAWYRKAAAEKKNEIQTIAQFFYPLDGVTNWNRIYGPHGFIQYQFVVPDSGSYLIKKTLKKLKDLGAPSFLNVLKRFGPGNSSPMSFPMEGWTLAIDLPAKIDGLFKVLDEIDSEVIESGGRIYMAKDSRQNAFYLNKSYQGINKWNKTRRYFDRREVFYSSMAKRYKFNL
tara:strand:- start:9841 stop:11262 length:1422 start_codon:yes stop_codon:yes gene_type:complete